MVLAALDAFAREIGQIPIHYKQEYHGYIFNSIFVAMQRQALDLVIEGVASFEDIDRSWMGIVKMPIGPFGIFDQIGLDTSAEILDHWAEALNSDSSHYGGSNVGNLGGVTAEPVAHHGQPASAVLALPPLGTLVLWAED